MKNGKILSINGVDCSCSILGRVWISEDGAVVAPNEYGKAGGPLPVMNDTDGPFVVPRFGTKLRTATAVNDAWNDAYPGDGPKKVIYRDKNVMNTHKDNLKWGPDLCPYTQTTSFLKKVSWMGQDVTVYKSGKVMYKGTELPLQDHYHDTSHDCERFAYKPFVLAGKLQLGMDDLMAAACFVGGDPTGMMCPKVLHKDHDMLNFDSGNLEWAEFSSPEYQDYISDMIYTCQGKSNEANPGKDVPPEWFRGPYCGREYYNYKASGKYGKSKP